MFVCIEDEEGRVGLKRSLQRLVLSKLWFLDILPDSFLIQTYEDSH